MECILGSCLPHNFQKLGDRPNLFESWGTRPTGPIGWLRLCLSYIISRNFIIHTAYMYTPDKSATHSTMSNVHLVYRKSHYFRRLVLTYREIIISLAYTIHAI